MGRRRTKPSLSDVLMDAPWWVSAVLAAASYIVFHAVVPAAFVRSPFLIGLAVTSRSLAWVAAHACLHEAADCKLKFPSGTNRLRS